MLIERRALLRGLFATPAIVAVGSLMPIRAPALLMPWQIGAEMAGVPYRTVQEAIDVFMNDAQRRFPLHVVEPAEMQTIIQVRANEKVIEPRFRDWSWKDGRQVFNGDQVVVWWRRTVEYGAPKYEAAA